MKIKTVLKIIFALSIIVPAISAAVYYTMNAENIPFESVCDKSNEKYTKLCNNVGKRANSLKGMSALNNKDYGKIIGLAWRQRGSIISAPGQDIRYSQSNSYYYIISSDTKGYYTLNIVSEVDPR